MFKAIRVGILLLILLVVAMNAWLTQSRSTDWNNSLWVKIYPINADGSQQSERYIDKLTVDDFAGLEAFLEREVARYGKSIDRPLRVELGEQIREQPPQITGDSPGMLDVMLWSLKMRWWASNTAGDQDTIVPDVRMFVRFHETRYTLLLENSVGLQKGMIGIVNAYASRAHSGVNNVVIAHEFLHTLGASDKYDPAGGQPLAPDGLADPEQSPLYPQARAEIMGGRIALAPDDAVIPSSLGSVVIGPLTAHEINLID